MDCVCIQSRLSCASYEDPPLPNLAAPLSAFTDSKDTLIQDNLDVTQHMMFQILCIFSQIYQITFCVELGVQVIRMCPIFLYFLAQLSSDYNNSSRQPCDEGSQN